MPCKYILPYKCIASQHIKTFQGTAVFQKKIPATSKPNNPIFLSVQLLANNASSLLLLTVLKVPEVFIHATEKLTISWLTGDCLKIEDSGGYLLFLHLLLLFPLVPFSLLRCL